MIDIADFPAGWTTIVLHEYSDAHIDWCITAGLKFGIDCIAEYRDTTIDKDDDWPVPSRLREFVYHFKDPMNATAFSLIYA